MRISTLQCALIVVALLPVRAHAQCGSVDPASEKATFSGGVITLTWSPFAGASASTRYDVFAYTAQSYCAKLVINPGLDSGPISGTSYSFPRSADNIYFLAVRVVGCVSSPVYSGPTIDLYSAPPPPTLSVTKGTTDEAIFAVSSPSDEIAGIIIQRANLDGSFPDFPGCLGCTSPESSTYSSEAVQFANSDGSFCPSGSTITDTKHPMRFLHSGTNIFRACGVHLPGRVEFACGAAASIVGSDVANVDLHGSNSFPEGTVNGASVVLTRDSEAATGAFTVTLTASDPSIVVVPASVTVPAGESSAGFTLAANRAGQTTIIATTPWGTSTSAPVKVVGSAVFTPLSTPAPIIVRPSDVGSSTFTVTNTGSAAGVADVSVARGAPAVDVSPKTITLSPGDVQTITIRSEPASGAPGSVTPVTIRLLGQTSGSQPVDVNTSLLVASEAPITEPVSSARRVDVAAPIDVANPAVQVTFNNPNAVSVSGTVVSDAPWLIPVQPALTIPANGSAVAQLTIDRTKRPDATAPLGSVIANVSYIYSIAAIAAKPFDGGQTSRATVSVVDTATVRTTQASLPPLGPNEKALIIPGIGHTPGSVGLFISDLGLLNLTPSHELRDIKLFYTAPGSSPFLATIPQLLPLRPVLFSDVVKNLFNSEGSAGSLQIRFPELASLASSVSVFNSSNARGTYGTGIPVLRSDRAAQPAEQVFLVGLRSDAQSHTNLYLQEMSGRTVTVDTRFLSLNGSVLSERSDTLGPFAIQFLGSIAPPGAVSAILTHAGGDGTFLAYATPVDASGDTWAIVDWRRQFAAGDASSLIVPTAGAIHGANGTYFKTDIAVMNTGTATLSGTLRFTDRNGAVTDKPVTLAAKETFVSSDVVSTYFGIHTEDAGFITFSAPTAAFAITSRTFTDKSDQTGTYGTAVPALAPAFSIGVGQPREITGASESASSSIRAGKPATFRTNFGLVETTGNSAVVRVTVRFSYPAGTRTLATGEYSHDYAVGPNEYSQRGVKEVLGAVADTLGDIAIAAVQFEVISGNGRVLPYVSSVDNGTGDSVIRVE